MKKCFLAEKFSRPNYKGNSATLDVFINKFINIDLRINGGQSLPNVNEQTRFIFSWDSNKNKVDDQGRSNLI